MTSRDHSESIVCTLIIIDSEESKSAMPRSASLEGPNLRVNLFFLSIPFNQHVWSLLTALVLGVERACGGADALMFAYTIDCLFGNFVASVAY